MQHFVERLAQDGFVLVPGVFDAQQAAKLADELAAALCAGEYASGSAVRNRAGTMVAARNVLALYRPAATLWRRGVLPELLSATLGASFGLARALFFDKPPDRTWSLAWHRDLTIAVEDNSLSSDVFAKPTRKAGVPHVEAPVELLDQMLTLRIHLDEVTDENGPLQVIPGSHRTGKSAEPGGAPVAIYAQPGDVLAMRPLISHGSGASRAGTHRHRRILHLEFAGPPELPDGYRWHDFVP